MENARGRRSEHASRIPVSPHVDGSSHLAIDGFHEQGQKYLPEPKIAVREPVFQMPAIAAGGAPADLFRLQHGDLGACPSELPGGAEAGEATADHRDVVIAIDGCEGRGGVVPVGQEFHGGALARCPQPGRSRRSVDEILWPKQVRQRQVPLHDRRFQHDEAEILVYADLQLDQPLHDLLIFADPGGHEFQEVVVAARDHMAFD